MRIITGIYKGRRFDIPRTFKARPTTDFAKESIFNVVNGYINLDGCTAVDLFSGTGSIALEMLSRGCAEVISVEADKDHYAFIRQCLKKIGATNCMAIRGDALKFIKSCHRQFDFIFADPPYSMPEIEQIPQMIIDKNMIADGGLFVFEHGKGNDFSAMPRFVEHRAYGSVNFSLFQ